MHTWVRSTLAIYFSTMFAIASESLFVEKEITKYPFSASAERSATIRGQYQRVEVGMSPREVKSVLGEPDEIRRLHNASIGNERQVGYTYWFVIRRAVKNEKQEIVVRVSFDLNGLVMKIDHWGLEDAN
jgi:hypothetical protein